MTRRIAAVLVSLAAVIGLLDPFACRWYSMQASLAAVSAVPADRLPLRPLPKAARDRLLDTAKRALAMLPAPSGYALDRESVDAKVDEKAIWAGSAFGTPGTARAECVYEPALAGYPGEVPPTLEQRVFVNSEVTLPAGLASVGGSPKPFDVPGAVGVVVTTITDTEDSETGSSEGGRVALPLTPAQKRTAITIVRVLLANSKTERLFRTAITEGAMPTWTPPAPKKPGEIQTLVIEIYGGKADVEAAGKHLPVGELRKLLD